MYQNFESGSQDSKQPKCQIYFHFKNKKNKGKHNNFNTRICRTIFIILFYFMEYVQQIDIGNTHGFVHKRVRTNSHKNEVDYTTERDGLAVLV